MLFKLLEIKYPCFQTPGWLSTRWGGRWEGLLAASDVFSMLGNININIEVLVHVLFFLNNVQHPKKSFSLQTPVVEGEMAAWKVNCTWSY